MGGLKYALLLIGLLFLLTVLFIFAYYGNRYRLSYRIDNSSLKTISRTEQRNRNSRLNIILIIMGPIARNPGATGAGLLASSGQDQEIRWKNVRKAAFYPAGNTITVSGGFGEKGIIFCTKENYDTVSDHVRSMCGDSCRVREK